MKDKRIHLVITGGTVSKDVLEAVLSDYRFEEIWACDKGAESCRDCGVLPDHLIGDFDSADEIVIASFRDKTDVTELPVHKDVTDTHAAVLEILCRRPDEVILIGATGTRLDHTLANIGLLKLFLDEGIEAHIIDDHNRITMCQESCTISHTGKYPYISLLPFTEAVTGITLSGFVYGAEKLTISQGESIGISNELVGEDGTITIKQGVLLVIESCD